MLKPISSFGSFLSASLITFAAVAQQSSANADGPLQVAGNAAAAQQPGAPAWINIVLIVGIIVFMWLFVFRPQSKRAKEQKEFLSSLTPGIEVITTGGLIGTIADVKENIVSINVGNNSTVRVLKSAISGKLNTTTEVTK
jgi:preprotein translocase subunit YajC